MRRLPRFLSAVTRDPAAEAESVWERPEEAEIAAAYVAIVREQIEAAGIPGDAVSLEMVVVGRTGSGRPALAAMLKLRAWSGRPSVRLLLGLPLFEARVRRCLRNHWLADVSFFAGLWLHPSAPVREPRVLQELRELLLRMEDGEPWRAQAPAEPAGEGLWSVPGVLESGSEPARETESPA